MTTAQTLNPGFAVICGIHTGKPTGPSYRVDITKQLASRVRDKQSTYLRGAKLIHGADGTETSAIVFSVREDSEIPKTVGQWRLAKATPEQEAWALDRSLPSSDFPIPREGWGL